MKTKITLLFTLFALVFSANAQEKTKATYVGKVASMVHVPSIASRTNLPPATTKEEEMEDGRASRNLIVPGKDKQKEDDYFVRNPNKMEQKISGKAPTLVFDAAAFKFTTYGSFPRRWTKSRSSGFQYRF